MTNVSDNWLITGGAGYIGSHISDLFLTEHKQIIIYDSLSKGLKSRIRYLREKHHRNIPLIVADIRDDKTFNHVIRQYEITGIIHTAGLKAVSESFLMENEYLDVNLNGTTQILEIAKDHGIRKFIFSSTAAVYGDGINLFSSKEDDKTKPISPYAESKLLAEAKVTDFLNIKGNIGASLRFFNVIGSSNYQLRDSSIDNLIPIVLGRLKDGVNPIVYGNDYLTSDGTCVRDFVDVRDVARAHCIVANIVKKLPPILNIGTGEGTSVLEVIQLILEISMVSGVDISFAPRRKGDPPSVIANVELAKSLLGYRAEYQLKQSIESIIYNC